MSSRLSGKSCKIIMWNVRSILKDLKLNNFLQLLEDNDIQVACLCETWFDSQNGTFTATIKAAGYEILHGNRDDNRGGGTAILYRKTMKVKRGEASTSKYKSFEYSHVSLKQVSDCKITLVCIHRKQEI